MTYTLEYAPSPNCTVDLSRRPPVGIVIHHWGTDGQRHDNVVAHLRNPSSRVSAHYVASAGRVTCLVDPLDTAWHAGNWPVNESMIGIECRPEISDADFRTVAELIAHLRARFGPLPLSGHRDHYATACPGRWYPRLNELSSLADQIAANENPEPVFDDSIKENNMYLIRTTTPWNTYAYALITLSGLGGARAIEQSEADIYYPVLGVNKVGWQTWNLLVERAWQAHAATLETLGKTMNHTIEEAVQKVVNHTKNTTTGGVGEN